MTNPVVIVGAGAAGIGAGLELAARGIPFVILEAANRVGGRAFTDTTSLPGTWDHGCHWLHCADVNPLVGWADRLGVGYERQDRLEHFTIWADGNWLDKATLQTARSQTTSAFAAVYEAAALGRDVPISEVIPQTGRWQAGAAYILQLMASEDADRVSTLGYGDYDDTEVNWPVTQGYGTLIARMAQGLPVRLNTAVTAVAEQGNGVQVQTSAGVIEARAAILTTSTNVLLSGAIDIGAGAACEMLEQISDLPCGAYEKVAIALRRTLIDDPAKLFAMVDPGDGTPIDFQLSSAGPPMMTAHIAGSVARDLVAAGAPAMRDFALARLVQAFGALNTECSSIGMTGILKLLNSVIPFAQGSVKMRIGVNTYDVEIRTTA